MVRLRVSPRPCPGGWFSQPVRALHSHRGPSIASNARGRQSPQPSGCFRVGGQARGL